MGDRPDAAVVPWVRPMLDWGVAAVVLAALTTLAMWPALSRSGTIMGSLQPSDATSGGVRTGWLFTMYAPFSGRSMYLGAPQGMPFWPFTYYTSLAWLLPQWVLAHLFGAVMSWNLDVALGFVLDGLAMFGLIRWLTNRRWPALVGAVLYAFSPFHVEESYAHIGYVWTWIFPLVVWACLWLIKRPTLKRGAMVGALVGISGYIDPYFLLFAPLLAGIIALFSIAFAPVAGVRRSHVVLAYAGSVIAAIVIVLPLAVLYLTAPASSKWLVTSRTALRTSRFIRAQLWEYVVPWENSPLWGGLTKSWIKRQLGIVPPIETSLYLGIGVLVLALGWWIWWLIHSRRHDFGERKRLSEGSLALPLDFIAAALLAAGVITFICSFATIGPLPGVPHLVWDVLPLWRVFSRMDAVVDCVVVVAACLGLMALARSRYAWTVPLLALLALADGSAILPWESWSYAANTPAVYSWLSRHQDGGIVAEYPMQPPVLPAYIAYNTYQIVQKHPLFNGALPGSLHSQVERGVADLNDPQTLPTLRRFGVKYVIVNRPLYDNPVGSFTWKDVRTSGLALILARDGFRLYRILPGPRAPAALTVVSGFGLEHPFFSHVERWMSGATARIGIDPFKTGELRIRFKARSYKLPRPARSLRVYQSGRLVWSGAATEAGTWVTFKTASSAPLVLRSAPGGVHIPGFLDTRSIDVIRLSITRG